MKLEEHLAKILGYAELKATSYGGGGCISSGQTFVANPGNVKLFVKQNQKDFAETMFKGEFASLEAIAKTGQIKVPKPVKIVDFPDGRGGALLMMEHVDIEHLSSSGQKMLGTQLANLHLDNIKKGQNGSEDYVSKFGFDLPTCCGSIPQGNSWTDDWTAFYTNKLQEQLDLVEKDYGDSEARKLWNQLKPKMADFFKDLDIKPSLLHGDLWSGNAGQSGGEPVIFDAASFYGHHEYDLGITGMFGGFSNEFYSSYHKLIPKQPGFEQRHQLYQLFHYLNHWNHFGGGYKSQSLSIMRRLVK